MDYFEIEISTHGMPKISAITIEKESEHFVTIKGRRVAKIANWKCYFPTKEACIDYAESFYQNEIEKNKADIQRLQKNITKYEGCIQKLDTI